MSNRPPLQVISGDATPDEVAAISAALTVVYAEREAAARAAAAAQHAGGNWVWASRLGARRAGLIRGPWRLSGRIGRRARA
jgi:hypothetical protein